MLSGAPDSGISMSFDEMSSAASRFDELSSTLSGHASTLTGAGGAIPGSAWGVEDPSPHLAELDNAGGLAGAAADQTAGHSAFIRNTAGTQSGNDNDGRRTVDALART